jgi:glutathione S-transferase
MSLTLYEHPLSPYARKVKIALYEKGIPFERVFVAPMTAKEGDAEFAEFSASSPRREVPCLVDGDLRLFDSTIIVDYLDDKWPDRQLLPPNVPELAQDRARARMAEEIGDTILDAINWGLMEIRFFKRVEKGPKADAMIARAGTQLAAVWDRLESDLGGRPWFSGASFGRADASLVVHFTASALFGFAPLDRHAKVRAWFARCLDVESVKRDQADLATFMASNAARSMRGAPVRRQYRDHRLEWMMKTGGLDVVLKGLEQDTIHFVAWP